LVKKSEIKKNKMRGSSKNKIFYNKKVEKKNSVDTLINKLNKQACSSTIKCVSTLNGKKKKK